MTNSQEAILVYIQKNTVVVYSEGWNRYHFYLSGSQLMLQYIFITE